jgi:large subunit ribosomal protein L21
MFAVIRTGGKQYKVAKDDVIAVEKLAGEAGAAIELAEVLMIGEGAEVATGTPLLAGASVAATVVEQKRAPKIIVFKKQRRKNYRRKKGHRQYQTVLHIDEIRGAVGSLPAEDERPVVEAEPAAAAGPVTEAKPVTEVEPAVEAEPVTEVQPAVEAGPVAEAGPAGGEGASNGA